MTGVDWTFGNIAALIGLVLSAVAAAGGTAAAIYSRRANLTADVATRPALLADHLTPRPGQQSCGIWLSNTGGGAAQPACIAVGAGGRLYFSLFPVRAHLEPRGFELEDRGISRFQEATLLVLAARDASGRWWNHRNSTQIKEPVPSPGTPEFIRWLEAQCRTVANHLSPNTAS